jgi:hypothetical protein
LIGGQVEQEERWWGERHDRQIIYADFSDMAAHPGPTLLKYVWD